MNAVLQFVVVPDSEAIAGQEGKEGETTTAGIFPSAHCSLPLSASQPNCKALQSWQLLQEEVLGAVLSPRLLCESEFQHLLQQQLSWDLSFFICVHVSTHFFLTDPFGLEESPS